MPGTKDHDKTKGQLIRELAELRQRIAELEKSEAVLEKEAILNTLVEHVIHEDREMKILWANGAACDSAGLSCEELIGRHCYEIWPKRSDPCPDCPVMKAMETGQLQEMEKMTSDGRFWFIRGYPLRDEKDNIVGGIEFTLEITERKRAEDALRESEEKYRSLVEFTEDPVYLVNRQKQYLFMNAAYLARLGLPRDHVIGKTYGEFHSCEETQVFSEYIEQVFKSARFVQYEHESRRDDKYFLRTLSPVKEPDGSIEALTVISKDITERKRAEEELTYMATHDSLTGLPNRMLFSDRLAQALAQAHRRKKKFAVMLLDLDHFKDVNDSLGHSVGDQLLRAVGNRLRGLLRKGDTIARVGGDEFLLLVSEIARLKDVKTVAQKILDAFQKSVVFDSHTLQISASIGVAIYPDDGDNDDTLLHHADIAMYRAKEKGRGNYQRFIPLRS